MNPLDNNLNPGIACGVQLVSFIGGLVALFWWFIAIWSWLGLFWAIAATIVLGFIPAAILYWLILLAFGPLTILSFAIFGRNTAAQLFVGGMGVVIGLLLSVILVGSVVVFFKLNF